MTGQAFDPGEPVGYAWAGDFLERYVDARVHFRGDAFVDLFAEDGVLQPDPFEPPIVGPTAIRAYLLASSAAEAGVDLEFERHWVSGATILAPWHASFGRPDGSRVREAGFMTAEIRSERVVRLRIWTVTKHEGP